MAATSSVVRRATATSRFVASLTSPRTLALSAAVAGVVFLAHVVRGATVRLAFAGT